MPEIVDIPTDAIKPQTLQRPVSPQGIDELASSIRKIGLLEPLLIVEHQDNYFLIAGQRRLLAAQQLNMATVPCIIVPADQEKALAMSLHENLFRENLSVIDEASMFAYLRDSLSYSNRSIAKMISKSEPYVSQRLALLTWDPIIQEGIRSGGLSFSVARELSQVHDAKHRRYLVKHAIDDGINYRTARMWVTQWKMSKVPPKEVLEDGPNPLAQSAPIKSVVPCYWCEQDIPIEDVTSVWLCPFCMEQMTQAKAHSRK